MPMLLKIEELFASSQSTKPSATVETRLALFAESGNPLARVGMMIGDSGFGRNVIQSAGERRFRRIVDRALEHAHRHLRSFCQFSRAFERPIEQPAGGDCFVDEAELQCFSAGYDAVTHEEV